MFKEFDEDFPQGVPEISDPLRPFNRTIYGFNDRFYRWVARPLAKGYAWAVPEKGRAGIERMFDNLGFPIVFVNSVLQGKAQKAGTSVARFVLNTTVGLLGFFDPAQSWFHLHPVDEDFGQTLGHYGVGPGPPLTLPLLGPSNLRDAIGKLPDLLLSPFSYVPAATGQSAGVGGEMNSLSLDLGEYESMQRASLDPYLMMTTTYRQMRRAEVKE